MAHPYASGLHRVAWAILERAGDQSEGEGWGERERMLAYVVVSDVGVEEVALQEEEGWAWAALQTQGDDVRLSSWNHSWLDGLIAGGVTARGGSSEWLCCTAFPLFAL